MECPKCTFANPETAKFCGQCGKKLESLCPECKSPNPPQFKFCNECGYELAANKTVLKELSFDEKLDKIQRYLPKGVTDKIISQRGRIEGERKQVAVLFCDLAGFTSMVETIGPDESYNLMDRIYEILIHKVHEYEGTVNEMTGDGVLALFGAPIAIEDAPQRAIRSAMAIHKEITKFNEDNLQDLTQSHPLKMRIGIHTGPVVVGTLGNNLRVEFKAVGDTVNIASRMETLAEPGTTCVSEDTFKLTEGFFRFEALGAKEIKGKEDPISVFRVIATSASRTRFDVSAERGLTRFIGRQRELELLIDGFERTKQGFGQAFSIVSEAGAGKSRLLYEFRKAVTNEDITFLESKCLSFSKNVAYHPVINLIKSSFGILNDDDDTKKVDKIKGGLRLLGIDQDSILIYLLELLSVTNSGFDKTSMSPESKKDRTMEALKQISLRTSELKPLVLVFEDLHWIDKSSEEYLKLLIGSISGAKIQLIFTYRPDFISSWENRSFHSRINLNRLSSREILDMSINILGTEKIDENLKELIISKSDGIPLFTEEFVKSLKDLNVIEAIEGRLCLSNQTKTFTIPSTIHEVIAARVDILPDTAKKILQIGSAIEREFDFNLIKRITGLPDNDLISVLSTIVDSELIYERGIFPDTTYVFKHALTRDVIYDSILQSRKKQLHRQIGETIETLFTDRIGDYYGILAGHFSHSTDYTKAANYAMLAGKKAAKVVSFTEAISFIKKGVCFLEKLPLSDSVEKKIIDARTTLGFYNVQLLLFGEAYKSIKPIIELAEKHSYEKRLAQIYSLVGIYKLWIEEDYDEAVPNFKKSIELSENTGNFVSLILSNHHLGHVYTENCEFKKGHHHIQTASSIVEMGNIHWSIALHKACIAFNVFCLQGDLASAMQFSQEAIQIAEKSGDLLSKSDAYTHYGACCLYKGLFEEAEKNLLAGITHTKKARIPNYEYIARLWLGDLYFLTKRYDKAQVHLKKAISIEKNKAWGPSFSNAARINLAAASIKKNETIADFKKLGSYLKQNKYRRYDGRIRRHFSIILQELDGNHESKSKTMIEQAIEMDTKNGLKLEVGLDYLVYADLFKKRKMNDKSKEKLSRAKHIFTECGADGWVQIADQEINSTK